MIDKVQKIRKEVERLQNELIQEKERGYDSDVDDACILELQNVLTYIDSLQEEPVSEELEEAIEDAMPDCNWRIDDIGDEIYENAYNSIQMANMFKAGAKWQEKQDQETIELAEDHAMFAGMEKMKEQMMAKAVDAHCFGFQGDALFSFRLPANNYLIGSEVKVIVIKKD